VSDAKHILVVDDDAAVATMLSRALSRHGFKIDTARTGDEALAKAAETRYDAAVLDLVMPGRDGADLSAALQAKTPGLTVAFLTGYARSPLIDAAKKAGRTVFGKPVVVQELVDFLRAELGL
jgi:DNA-binding response OmpR family regulator